MSKSGSAAAHDDGDEYVWTLNDVSLEKAKLELHEDPSDRMNAVRALRTWLLQQPHISFYTDTATLLSFLRTAKFSQLRAREMIENNAKIMTEHPRWVRNIDPCDPKLLKVIDTGCSLLLPKLDKNGCRLLMWRVGAAKTESGKMFPLEDEIRASMLGTLYLLRDETVQVNGCVFIVDMTGFTAKHLTRWTNTDLRKLDHAWQKCMPGRYKAFHHYNAGPLFDTLMALSKPFLEKKFQERIFVHDTMEDLYKVVDMELLPTEYLPDDYHGPNAGSISQIVANFKREITQPEFRQMILERTSERYGIDESKRPAYQPVNESFRKLAVD